MSLLAQNSGIIVSSGNIITVGAIRYPSGQFNSPINAQLISFNATFGYNISPSTFELEWVPSCFGEASGKLPELDRFVELNINNFNIRGVLTHVDYQDSMQGEILRTRIEDRRNENFRKLKIFTEDLGDPSLLPSGVVSISSFVRMQDGFLNLDGSVNELKAKEYERIQSEGATYAQILGAINYHNLTIGNTHITADKLPTVPQLLANMSGNIDANRWQFTGNTLDEAITNILQDISYDWYYNMQTDSVMLVNKKLPFLVTEDNIPITGDNAPGKSFSYGKDIVREATKFRVYGGKQHGIVNSPKLSPIDGLNTPSGGIVFSKAWNSFNVGFFDAFGVYRTYTPTEKELQMAMKGLEWWAYYKKYQRNTSVTGFSDNAPANAPDIVASQHPDFQSRFDPTLTLSESLGIPSGSIRIISNRRDMESNWMIEWFNRVETHARTHYGRSYILNGFLFNESSGKFSLTDAAWCNLENQRASGELFTESYKIDNNYGVFAPFVTEDMRVKAHVILSSGTVYGADGESVPAAFTDWNEDPSGTLEHYIPCELREVGGRIKDPKDANNAFSRYPRGTVLCTLPLLAGSGKYRDSALGNLATLTQLALQFGGSGLEDLFDPTELVVAYANLSGVAIPVEAPIRYGQSYPQPWIRGESGVEVLEIKDDLVPWNFFPVASSTSVDILNQKALSYTESKVVPTNESQFAEVAKIGLPTISFDDFANQNANSSGLYGERIHGVTDLRTSYSLQGWWETTYGIKSYFAQFAREPLLGERNRAILDGIIHPIDFTEFNSKTGGGIRASLDIRAFGDPIPRTIQERQDKITKIPCRIFNVYNAGSLTYPEQYAAHQLDLNGNVINDRVLPSRYKTIHDGICIDGYLNIGSDAMYVNEQTIFHVSGIMTPNGTRVTGKIIAAEYSYFIGGHKLGGNIVTVTSVGGSASVAFKDDSTRTLSSVAIAPGTNVVVGDDALLVDGGGGKSTTPFNSNGYYLSKGGGTTTVPVEITSIIAGENTSGITVVANELASNLIASGTQYSGAYVVPFGAFTRLGDRGFLTQGSNGDYFVLIPRQTFLRFGN